MYEDASKLGMAIAKALKIPSGHGVIAIDLHVRVGDIPRVSVEFYPEEGSLQTAISELEMHRLEKPDGKNRS